LKALSTLGSSHGGRVRLDDRHHWSWTAGIVYGYKPPYDDKVIAHIGSFM
jgi:hypothetical protein